MAEHTNMRIGAINAALTAIFGDRTRLEGIDLRRVKACVNACAGIETGLLEDIVRHGKTVNTASPIAEVRGYQAQVRADRAVELLREIREALIEYGDGSCGQHCEAMIETAFMFGPEIEKIDAFLEDQP